MNPIQVFNSYANMSVPGYYTSLCVAVVAHELGHVFACRALGLKIIQIGINWRGPFVKRERSTPSNNLLVSLYGPITNLFLVWMTIGIMPQFAFVNLAVGVLNLLPIPTSDGRNIIRAIKEIVN